jgi:hypothetical protein
MHKPGMYLVQVYFVLLAAAAIAHFLPDFVCTPGMVIPL